MRFLLIVLLGLAGFSLVSSVVFQAVLAHRFSPVPSTPALAGGGLALFCAATILAARLASVRVAFAVLAPITASLFRIFLVAGASLVAVLRFPAEAPLFLAVLLAGVVAALAADVLAAPRLMRA